MIVDYLVRGMSMHVLRFLLFCTFVTFAVYVAPACTKQSNIRTTSTAVTVFVGIAPLKYVAERIGGPEVHVEVMLPPGSSPATWEPLPSQLMKLSRAKVYFSIDVPFEKEWLPSLKKNNPHIRFISLQQGITRRAMDSVRPRATDAPKNDPHSWLSPANMMIMARVVADTFSEIDAKHRSVYRDRLRTVESELRMLDEETKKALSSCEGATVMVFHPSYGYFCDRYGLRQLPIEISGRSPSPAELSGIIEKAKKNGVKTILVQKQFSETEAQTVAKAIGGSVVSVNPLDGNYPKMIREIREAIRHGCAG